MKKLREENDRGRVVLERLLAVLKEAKDAFPWPNYEANPGGHRLRVLLEEIGYDSRDGQVPAPLLDDVPSLNPLAGEVLALCQNICGRTVIASNTKVVVGKIGDDLQMGWANWPQWCCGFSFGERRDCHFGHTRALRWLRSAQRRADDGDPGAQI